MDARSKMMKWQVAEFLGLIGWVGGCVIIGVVSGLSTSQSVREWYPTLNPPPLTPPSWVFGPVWTVLYILMGVAAFIVWRRGRLQPDPLITAALIAFAVQLGLNFLWSPVFFGMRWPLGGLVVIIALWFAIVVSVVLFFRVSALAGALLLPYLAWVSFAAYLNAGFVLLNR
jgi:translocator protein